MSGHALLSILLAVVVVVVLALALIRVRQGLHEISQDLATLGGALETAGKVGANTANIPHLAATAPVLELIVEEAVIQDGYMNALTDGFGATERTSEVR